MDPNCQPTAAPFMQRWPQPQHLPQDYSMMHHQGLIPYDARAQSSAHFQRPPPVTPQYLMGPTYSSAAMSSGLTATHYQTQNPYTYGPYPSPPPSTSMPSPYREDFSERPETRIMGSQGSFGRALVYDSCARNMAEYQVQAHATRSNSLASNATSIPDIKAVPPSKTVSFNKTENSADQIDFNTGVDELMKVLQREEDEEVDINQTVTPMLSPKGEPMRHTICLGSPVASTSPPSADLKTRKKRKYICDGPNCNKAFAQKTHLDIHKRTHTGDRPFVCTLPGCGLTFTQNGNLKTHERRHRGEKPYKCNECHRGFAQQGNLRSHKETHKGLKPFACRLDGCRKIFSQLGNMKTHQNNFHKQALDRLTKLFVHYSKSGESPPEEDRELLEYFKQHFKNSNKGIKGRGKGRVVSQRDTKTSPRPTKMAVKPAAQFVQPPIPASAPQGETRSPAYTWSASAQPGLVGSVPRSYQYSDSYGMYLPEQAHHQQTHGIQYDYQPRQVVYPGRHYL